MMSLKQYTPLNLLTGQQISLAIATMSSWSPAVMGSILVSNQVKHNLSTSLSLQVE